MERDWSDAALAALDAYPWKNPGDRGRAEREAELVAFGEKVEVDDLPLQVRRWMRRGAGGARFVWRGESWRSLVDEFERSVLSQALAANGGSVAAAARALKTTARIVGYKARKHGLLKG